MAHTLTTSKTDFAGGSNFVILAVITLAFSGHHTARQILSSLFLILWATRLSGFLLFRILKTCSDSRFDDKRDKFFPFLGFWVFQMIWVWTVSLPVTILNSPNVTQYQQHKYGTACDIVGLIMWAIGFFMESWSDVQKYLFKSQHSGNKSAVCNVGLFSWTRHPNYFGEILLQFGIFTSAIAPSAYGYIPSGSGAYAAQYGSIVGPFFLTILLMFVSGLTLQERPGAKKRYESGQGWPEYKQWLYQTSILIPFPPQLYSKLPTIVKKTLFLEFPIYVFDPAKHADQQKVQDREAEEGDANRNGNSDAGLVQTTE